MAHVTQILYNTSPLQVAGRTHCQYALNIPRTAFALCAETALTPQYALTNNPFGKVIGWLDITVFYKCPQILLVFKDFTALTAQFAVKMRTLFQQRFNTLLKFWHSALKRFPLQRAVTNSLSQFQYFLGQTVKLLTYLANCTFGLTDRLEIPFQMRPAYLANQWVKIVGVITICYKLARKAAYQFTSRLLIAIGMNHKKCRCVTTKNPQPTLLPITSWPTGFISMAYILFSGTFSSFIVRLLKYIGQLGLAITQAAKTHRYREYLVHHCQCFTLARVEPAGQNCYQGQYAGTEVLTPDIIGQRSVNERSAVFASIDVLDILDDFGLDGWNINNLMTQWFFVGFFQVRAAACAHFGLEMKMFFYKLLRQKLSHVRFMTFSCSAFFASTLRQYDGHSGRIRRWRLRRILRIYSQKPFKFLDTLFQHCDMFFQCCVFRFQLLYICVFVHKTIIGQRHVFTKVYFNYSKSGERLRWLYVFSCNPYFTSRLRFFYAGCGGDLKKYDVWYTLARVFAYTHDTQAAVTILYAAATGLIGSAKRRYLLKESRNSIGSVQDGEPVPRHLGKPS